MAKGKWKYRIDSNSVKILKILPKDSIQSNKAIILVNNTFYGKEGEARAIRIVQAHNSFDGLLQALRAIEKGRGKWNPDDLIHAENTIDDMKELARSAIAEAERN